MCVLLLLRRQLRYLPSFIYKSYLLYKAICFFICFLANCLQKCVWGCYYNCSLVDLYHNKNSVVITKIDNMCSHRSDYEYTWEKGLFQCLVK